MAYTPYYAPSSRPMGYYNPSIPQQDMSNMQANQQVYSTLKATAQQQAFGRVLVPTLLNITKA